MSKKTLYYIISLKHTSKGDAALTFWGKNGSGYTYHKDRAGLYNEAEAISCESYDNVKVPQEKVDQFWMNAVDFEDKYIAVPNNPSVRYHFGLDAKYMKPKKWASCRMVFINTPVPIEQ